MRSTIWPAAFLAFIVFTSAHAAFIRPTIDSFSSQEGGFGGRYADNTVNGSGLSGESPSATHDSVSTNEWHTWTQDPNNADLHDPSSVSAFIAFDLGAPTNLSSAYIWNYSEALAYPQYRGRGVKLFDILVAPLGGGYTYLGTFELAKGGGDNLEPAQVIALGALNNPATQNVQLVRFDIRTNFHEYTSDVVGLSEVRFEGSLATVPGDYNGDSTVDAADYIVWRKTA